MKLNLVADYDVRGKKFATTFAIDASNNLSRLQEMTTLHFPTKDTGFIAVAPSFLLMCESKRRADEIATQWRTDYCKDGRFYYDYLNTKTDKED